MSFVIDASIAVKWFFPEPGTDTATRLLASDVPFYAPDLLIAEVSDFIGNRLRTKAVGLEQAGCMLTALPAMFSRLFSGGELAGRALMWSQALNQPARTCFYLACADETGCHLVSEDERLRQAGRGAGVTILSLSDAAARLDTC